MFTFNHFLLFTLLKTCMDYLPIDTTYLLPLSHTSLVAQMVKASAYNAGDPGSIPRLERSPGEGNANSLQYSCLENPMGRGACQPTVHVDSTEPLSFTFTFFLLFFNLT